MLDDKQMASWGPLKLSKVIAGPDMLTLEILISSSKTGRVFGRLKFQNSMELRHHGGKPHAERPTASLYGDNLLLSLASAVMMDIQGSSMAIIIDHC